MSKEKAIFAAGCFWHVEEAFMKLEGVLKTSVGYMGGTKENPSYEDVCSSKTRHKEVCLVEFDSKKISFKKLLEVFWRIHNPTQIGGQGLDIGDQYKSVIFYFSEKQKKQALESKKDQQKSCSEKIVTEILPAKTFWKAEEYHQKYLCH